MIPNCLLHRIYLVGYQGRVLPRSFRRHFPKSQIHRAWFSGHCGVFEQSGIKYSLANPYRIEQAPVSRSPHTQESGIPYHQDEKDRNMSYKNIPDPRHELPGRRLAENIKLTTADGHTVHLTVGYDPQEIDRPREVFYAGGFKSGSALEFQIQDTCVLISLLLQHGHEPADIAKSLAREEQPGGDLKYASVTGLIVEELENANLD